MAKTEIPIANLYYLLAYSWDHFVEGDEVDLSAVVCPDIHNLLAWVLASGIRRLFQRGIDRSYTAIEEKTPRLRGRILIAESFRHLTPRTGRMICEFDELSPDTIANRILRSTCDQLLRTDLITQEVRKSLRNGQRLLAGITPIALSSSAFQKVRLHRNNRHYRLLLQVCRMLFDTLLAEEQSGQRRFQDILRDEVRMPQLFENFVLNFARQHCPTARVFSERIRWRGEWTEQTEEVLPTMLTDVSINYAARKMILDCKFYRDALVTRHGRHRLHSAHLYQLNAYLQNKAEAPGWEHVEGILLYPAVQHRLDLSFRLLGHSIRIFSIDLDQPWPTIEQQLCQVLSE